MKSRTDLSDEVTQEDLRSSLRNEWIRQRVQNIHQVVTVQDVLRRFGVAIKYDSKEEQISCPFHGKDNRPSARAYPATHDRRSHVWCYVCQEHWDVISLWKRFHPTEHGFSSTLAEIERAFGIPVSERPNMPEEKPKGNEKLERLFAACEARLVSSRESFEARGYLTLCVLLDRLYAAAEANGDAAVIESKLQKILDKIGEKCRGR